MYKCLETSTRAFVHVCCLKLPDSRSRKAIVEHEVEKCIFKRTIVSEWALAETSFPSFVRRLSRRNEECTGTRPYIPLLELKSSSIESHRCGGRTSEVVVKDNRGGCVNKKELRSCFQKDFFFVRSVSKKDLRQSQNVSDLRAHYVQQQHHMHHIGDVRIADAECHNRSNIDSELDSITYTELTLPTTLRKCPTTTTTTTTSQASYWRRLNSKRRMP